MPQPKTGARKAASPAKGEAARAAHAEKAGEPRTVDFRGLTLTLPSEVPGTLYFDLAELDGDAASLGAQRRLLEGLIGAEQLIAVRNKVAEDQVPFDQVPDEVLGLLGDVLAKLGLGDAGEPSASPES